ncbi:MAG: 4Fe-4S binding protein [bacterium]|nr:4Fe-4S binding protein [bacterium]
MQNIRRLSQIIFFILFLGLILRNVFPLNVSIPVNVFIYIDPLLGISTILATREIIGWAFWGIISIIVTIIAGRVFCGWVCPLGTLSDIFPYFIKSLPNINKRSLRKYKYLILLFIIVSSLLSFPISFLFDPLMILSRSFTMFFYPVLVYFVNLIIEIDLISNVGSKIATLFSKYAILTDFQPKYQSSLGLTVIIFIILFLGMKEVRFWCKNLCPLGALFALFAKIKLLKRNIKDNCQRCNKCVRICKMKSIEKVFPLIYKEEECILCLNCVYECPTNSIKHKLEIKFAKRISNYKNIDISRRDLINTAFLSFLALGVGKTDYIKRSQYFRIIRPPGAIKEEEFTLRCIRCGNCIKICASNGHGLQPILLERGWEAIWTPKLSFQDGYCAYNCNLCGQVCPTKSIKLLSKEEKKKLKIGKAIINKELCIPWKEDKSCLVCEEHCPLPKKAIKFKDELKKMPTGVVKIRRPYILEDICTGCGICEYKCPAIEGAGIYVIPRNNSHINNLSLT